MNGRLFVERDGHEHFVRYNVMNVLIMSSGLYDGSINVLIVTDWSSIVHH